MNGFVSGLSQCPFDCKSECKTSAFTNLAMQTSGIWVPDLMCYVKFTTPPSYIGILLILIYFCLKLHVCNVCVLVWIIFHGLQSIQLLTKRAEASIKSLASIW